MKNWILNLWNEFFGKGVQRRYATGISSCGSSIPKKRSSSKINGSLTHICKRGIIDHVIGKNRCWMPDRKRYTDTSRRRHRSRRLLDGRGKVTLLRLKKRKTNLIWCKNTGRRSFVRRCFQLRVTYFRFISRPYEVRDFCGLSASADNTGIWGDSESAVP